MSDILQNANLYTPTNTARVDVGGQNAGQTVAGQSGVVGFDCSGYYYHVMRESGYDISHMSTSAYAQSSAIQDVANADVRPGDTVFFEGHMGFVVSYNAVTQTGIYRSMTGSHNNGTLKDSPFSTTNLPAANNGPQYWGVSESASGNTGKSFMGFGRIDPSTYKPELDLHKDGNQNPVLHPLDVAPQSEPTIDAINAKVTTATTTRSPSFSTSTATASPPPAWPTAPTSTTTPTASRKRPAG